MLQAQVNYWNLVETAKHNRQMEQTALDTLAESIRHSMATESLESQRNRELMRHNMASETLESVSNTAKMKSANAALSQAATAATRVANDYALGLGGLEVSRVQAAAAQSNAATNAYVASFEQAKLNQRQSEMYAGMANTAISSLGHIGATGINAYGNYKSRSIQQSEPKTIYRMIVD